MTVLLFRRGLCCVFFRASLDEASSGINVLGVGEKLYLQAHEAIAESELPGRKTRGAVSGPIQSASAGGCSLYN